MSKNQRDQDASVFAVVLARLCDSLPAIAAALVDGEGETVDYAGRLSPFDTRVAAAELQLVLNQCLGSRFFSTTRRITVRSAAGTHCVVALADGYSLVVRLPMGSFTASQRAWNEGIREVCAEAGLRVPDEFQHQRWLRVRVREDGSPRHRPAQLRFRGEWYPVEVLGRYQGDDLTGRELGYRVRLQNGFETTLVRERLGRWFSDHLRFETEGLHGESAQPEPFW